MLFFGSNLRTLFSLLPVVVLAVSVHEFAHAGTAYLLGDRSQRSRGRLSLNPLRHFEWTGFLALLIFGFGWGRPVEIDPRRFRHPRVADTLVALAGPGSNLLVVVATLILLNGLALSSTSWLGTILSYTAVINTSLAVFNLLPIPPLDGSHLVYNLMPQHIQAKFLEYGRLGIIALFTLFMVERVFNINIIPLGKMVMGSLQLLNRLALSFNLFG